MNRLIVPFHFKVICISPTYERAIQTGQMAEKMGKFWPEVKIGYAVRGERGEKLEPEKYAQAVKASNQSKNCGELVNGFVFKESCDKIKYQK